MQYEISFVTVEKEIGFFWTSPLENFEFTKF